MKADTGTLTVAMRQYKRKETFLARYRRSSKLIVTAGLLLLSLLPFVWPESWDIRLQKSLEMQKTILEPAPKNVVSAGADTVGVNQPSVNQPAMTFTTAETSNLSPAAMAMNDNDDRDARMARAPDPGLTEDTADGGLPRIGEDGRKVWQIYARPFNMNDKRPRIAIVMANMGMARTATDAAIRRLPANVTIAFDIQSPVIGAWLARARQDGHETLLDLPMEPFDYPRSDPGPGALLVSLPNSDNIQRLLKALKKGTGYVGVTTFSGSRFISDPAKVLPVLEEIKRRGLMVFDSRVAPRSTLESLAKQMKIPVSTAVLQIDKNPSPGKIDSSLRQLEQIASTSGRAVGIASPLPATLDRLEEWIKHLPERGFALTPLTAVTE